MPQINQDAANIPSVNLVEQGSDIATPGSGHVQLYAKNGALYIRLDDGTVLSVGGAVALTADSLAVGGPGDTLTALTPGAEGAVPTRQADGSIEEVVPTPGGGDGDLVYISEVVVPAGGQATIEFATIAATYRALIVDYQLRSDRASNIMDNIMVRFNSDSGANYNWQHLNASATTPSASQAQGATAGMAGVCPGSTAPAGYVSIGRLYVPFYAVTAWNHIARSDGGHANGTGSGGTRLHSNIIHWLATTAISTITFLPENGTEWVEGSRAALYGQN